MEEWLDDNIVPIFYLKKTGYLRNSILITPDTICNILLVPSKIKKNEKEDLKCNLNAIHTVCPKSLDTPQ